MHAVCVLHANRYQRDREGRTALDWAERFGSAQLADVMRYDPKRVSSPALSSILA
jgi:ankyrin repeat protein